LQEIFYYKKECALHIPAPSVVACAKLHLHASVHHQHIVPLL